MHTVQQIEDAVRQLSPEELALFRAWYSQFDAAHWDRQLAEDVTAGRLDQFADEAIQDFREGRCTDL